MGFFDKVKDMLSRSDAADAADAAQSREEAGEEHRQAPGKQAAADRDEAERTGHGSGYRTVTVRPGETFSGIAARHGVDPKEMARLNKLADPDLIYPGQVFRLPNG